MYGQAVLGRYIGSLRDAMATHTDERVRLESEAISGVLAMKVGASSSEPYLLRDFNMGYDSILLSYELETSWVCCFHRNLDRKALLES